MAENHNTAELLACARKLIEQSKSVIADTKRLIYASDYDWNVSQKSKPESLTTLAESEAPMKRR